MEDSPPITGVYEMKKNNGTFFLYRGQREKMEIAIFSVWDGKGRLTIGTKYHEGTVSEMREHYKKAIHQGWRNVAECDCGQAMSVEDLIHVGRCWSCEQQSE